MTLATSIYSIKLFISFSGLQGFNDERHVKNFINYLFSNSKNHKKNEVTKLNIAMTHFDQEISRSFNINAESVEEIKCFSEHNNERLSDYKQLTSAVFYVGFIIKLNDNLYTNMLDYDNENKELTLSWNDVKLNQYLEENSLEKEVFFERINELIEPFEPYEKGEIILFDEIIKNDDLSNEIQFYIFSELELMYRSLLQKNEMEKLIDISHIDQKDNFYHIHSIYYHK